MIKLDILYRDKQCIVAQKDTGVICEDTCENSVPAIIRASLGVDTFPVHRIDKVAGGALLLGLSPAWAERLRSAGFDKEYLFVTVGAPKEAFGEYRDLLYHDTRTNKSFIVKKSRKGVREAVLEYKVISTKENLSLVKAKMLTGRTHQIRLQFSSRGTPLYGDRRYGGAGDKTALWSYRLSFVSGGKEQTVISLPPSEQYPWSLFSEEVSSI